ncbi:hypothetical protein ENSA5_66690 [Enhygromyxa salina]|uniref:Methyltransferase type 11 domain-containing protein n=1 Tax=Enhygromyxa salina TaxID=215803 RepID=A0A2S9XBN4_9BACT|nr:class I SAM-dependent methyltransferase [Enhygromyxa salina]PRP90256.1 hypothetical protein ENSA5_66690 [Enhygromyxa salina]
MSNPRSTAASVREQKLARVIDREVAPIWHDRFARLLMRELPSEPETFALDIHSGPGHTTAELLQRLDESSRIVALGRDPWLMQVSKTRVRPEWKRRVYFKSGDIDDVTGMNDDTYDLAVANLVLGEQVVEWQPALAELVRVTKPGGQVMTTLPLYGTWQEVEDLFEEMLRDEGMRREVATLQKLRRRRPKPSQLVTGLEALGFSERDFVVEHERFELLFRSGREFLFSPVIEHGPLRLWKAIIGRAEKPQALFWRFKEAIDTYYAGHVLAVTVVAGLVRLRVPDQSGASFAAGYWSRYPSLAKLWGVGGDEALDGSDDDLEFDLDLDIDLDESDAAPSAPGPDDSASALDTLEPGSGFADGGRGFADMEVSGANELPAVEDVALDGGDDPFAGLLEELDAEAAAEAELAAEDAEVEATIQPRKHAASGRAATLGTMEHPPVPLDAGQSQAPVRKPGESGVSRRPSGSRQPGESGVSRRPPGLSRQPGESGVSPRPPGLAPKPGESGTGPIASKSGTHRRGGSLASRLPGRKSGESGASPLPGKLPPPPSADAPKLPPPKPLGGGSLASKLPRRAGSSGVAPIPPIPGAQSEVVPPPGKTRPKASGTKSLLARLPKREGSGAGKGPVAPPSTGSGGAGTGPAPRVTKPGEADPFAAMLDDEELEEIDDIDDIEELPGDSLIHGEFDDDEDIADAFDRISPDPAASQSGVLPPPPPPPRKKK